MCGPPEPVPPPPNRKMPGNWYCRTPVACDGSRMAHLLAGMVMECQYPGGIRGAWRGWRLCSSTSAQEIPAPRPAMADVTENSRYRLLYQVAPVIPAVGTENW